MEAIIFAVVTTTSILATMYLFGMSQIGFLKKNWVQYRCNPIYMPMAGLVGQDVVKNFTQCTMKGFHDYTGFVMDPVMAEVSVITDSVSEIAVGMDEMRSMMGSVRGGFLGILGTVFGKIQNVMSQTQYIVIRMRTLMARIVGVLMSFIYVFYGGMETGSSVMNGPIGKTVEML
jgi:hypothetical protein